MTRSAVGRAAFVADCADARAAHALDAQAWEKLVAIPAAHALLARWVSRRRKERTRGPEAEITRRVAKLHGTPEVRALLAAADARYWAMVYRHDAMVHVHARSLGRKVAATTEAEDVVQIVRLGWFAAALRFDPTRDLAFPTMAGNWAMARVQRERDIPGGIKVGRSRANAVRVSSLDVPAREDGETTLLDNVVSEEPAHDLSVIRRKDVAKIMELTRSERNILTDKERYILTEWGTGRTAGAIGLDLDPPMTRAGVSYARKRALHHLQEALTGRTSRRVTEPALQLSNETRMRILEMYRVGESLRTISKATGVSRATLTRRLQISEEE